MQVVILWIVVMALAGPLPLQGDFDGDKDVDQTDFGILQRHLGNTAMMPVLECDLNGDLRVDSLDVDLFLKLATGPR